jgi:membrane-bound lytic murein transglycosylase D
VPIERDIDVALVARLAGLSLEEFQQLNPQLNKPVILAAGTPQVLLPYDNANQFVRSLPLVQTAAGQLDRLGGAAHAEGGRSGQGWPAPARPSCARLNSIPASHAGAQGGSTLLVPRTAPKHDNVAEHI